MTSPTVRTARLAAPGSAPSLLDARPRVLFDAVRATDQDDGHGHLAQLWELWLRKFAHFCEMEQPHFKRMVGKADAFGDVYIERA